MIWFNPATGEFYQSNEAGFARWNAATKDFTDFLHGDERRAAILASRLATAEEAASLTVSN